MTWWEVEWDIGWGFGTDWWRRERERRVQNETRTWSCPENDGASDWNEASWRVGMLISGRSSELGFRLEWSVEVTVKSLGGAEVPAFWKTRERESCWGPKAESWDASTGKRYGDKEGSSEKWNLCRAKHHVNMTYFPGHGFTLDAWEENSFQSVW